jgi:hypothetical protein
MPFTLDYFGYPVSITFYRSLSVAITGVSSHYAAIRAVTCAHVSQNYDVYQQRFTLTGDRGQYKKKHCADGEWATEVEITAACSALRVNIIIWSSDTGTARWIGYAPLHSDGQQEYAYENTNGCIYLDHTNVRSAGLGVHYDYVKAVQLL